jgi:NADP-dependent 3-hydroxy acid dehydrogenase YdfG
MNLARDRIAVVTGASGGVGQAIARALAAAGFELWLVGRRPEALARVAQAVRDHGATAHCCEADLATDTDLDRLLASMHRDISVLDVLVHSAGVIRQGTIDGADAAAMDLQYRTNVRAPYVLTRALLPALRAAHGQVVFVNSSAGLAARAGVASYAASKHALKALADGLREEVNADGVRVLSLYLGRTATAMQEQVHAAEGKPYRPELLVQPEDVAAAAMHALQAPRNVEITDISLRPMAKPA